MGIEDLLNQNQNNEKENKKEKSNLPIYKISGWGNLIFYQEEDLRLENGSVTGLNNMGQLVFQLILESLGIFPNEAAFQNTSLDEIHNKIIVTSIKYYYEQSVFKLNSLISMLKSVKSIIIKE